MADQAPSSKPQPIIELRLRGGFAGVNVPLFALYADGQVDYSKSKITGTISPDRGSRHLTTSELARLREQLNVSDWFYKLDDHYSVSTASDDFGYAVTVRSASGEKVVSIYGTDWARAFPPGRVPGQLLKLIDTLRTYQPQEKDFQ